MSALALEARTAAERARKLATQYAALQRDMLVSPETNKCLQGLADATLALAIGVGDLAREFLALERELADVRASLRGVDDKVHTVLARRRT